MELLSSPGTALPTASEPRRDPGQAPRHLVGHPGRAERPAPRPWTSYVPGGGKMSPEGRALLEAERGSSGDTVQVPDPRVCPARCSSGSTASGFMGTSSRSPTSSTGPTNAPAGPGPDLPAHPRRWGRRSRTHPPLETPTAARFGISASRHGGTSAPGSAPVSAVAMGPLPAGGDPWVLPRGLHEDREVDPVLRSRRRGTRTPLPRPADSPEFVLIPAVEERGPDIARRLERFGLRRRDRCSRSRWPSPTRWRT